MRTNLVAVPVTAMVAGWGVTSARVFVKWSF